MAELVQLLHQRFRSTGSPQVGNNKYLTVYSHALFGERTPEESVALYEQRMQLEQQIVAFGYGSRKRKLQKDIKLNCCKL